MSDPTGAYYEDEARQFFDDTIAVDMSSLYARFLPRIPEGGRILDAGCGCGCGCGRDTRAFGECGYEVTAFDASPTLAALAADHAGLPIQVLRFQDIEWQDRFDGIWACASLLHVPAAELPGVLVRLADALKPGGLLYASFKYGQGEREHKGRRFTDLDETGLRAILREVSRLAELETWITTDLRPGREVERWLNTLLVANRRPSPAPSLRTYNSP